MLISPVSLPRDMDLLDGNITRVLRSDVHLLTARRNAWHSTKINQYSVNAATFTTASSARSSAHQRRKAGTYFEIDEMPALVFVLDELALVVMHLNVSPSFRSWKAPSALAGRDSPMTGIEAFNIFSSVNYRESVSGWGLRDGEPDVIIGLADSNALSSSTGRRQLQLERSSVDSSGWMYFNTVRKSRSNPSHLDRIIGELDHLTHRDLRVHEIAARFRITSSTVLGLLETVGSPAKGPRSWVDASNVERIRAQLRDARSLLTR